MQVLVGRIGHKVMQEKPSHHPYQKANNIENFKDKALLPAFYSCQSQNHKDQNIKPVGTQTRW
jgi:hypothetical protein